MSVRHGLLFLLAVLVSDASCLDPTEVIVEITTDMPCGDGAPPPSRLLDTTIKTGTTASDLTVRAQTMKCDVDGKVVGTFVLVPGASDHVLVQVDGHVKHLPNAMGMTDATLTPQRIIRFLQHQRLGLQIDLSASCIDITCPDGLTCSQGACIDPNMMGCKNADCIDAGIEDANPIVDVVEDDGNGIVDASLDLRDVNFTADGPSLDAVFGCPKPNFAPVLHWPFDDNVGSQSTLEVLHMQKTVLTLGSQIVMGVPPCGNALSITGLQQDLTLNGCPVAGCWLQASQLLLSVAIASVASGQTQILSHGPASKPGAWALGQDANNDAVFAMTAGGNTAVVTASSPPLGNKPQIVFVTASAGKITIQVAGGSTFIAQTSNLAVPAEATYDVVVASGWKGGIDELYVGSN